MDETDSQIGKGHETTVNSKNSYSEKKKKIKNLLLFRPQILSSVFQALEIVSKMTFIQFAYSCYIQNEAQLLLQ